MRTLKKENNKLEEMEMLTPEKDNEYPFKEEICSAEFPQGCIDPELSEKAE